MVLQIVLSCLLFYKEKTQFIYSTMFFAPETLLFFCISSCSIHDMFCLFLRAPNRVHFFVHQFVLFFAFFHATYHCFFSAFFSCAIWCFFCNSLCTKSCLKSCYCNWAWQNHNIEPAFFPEFLGESHKPLDNYFPVLNNHHFQTHEFQIQRWFFRWLWDDFQVSRDRRPIIFCALPVVYN